MIELRLPNGLIYTEVQSQISIAILPDSFILWATPLEVVQLSRLGLQKQAQLSIHVKQSVFRKVAIQFSRVRAEQQRISIILNSLNSAYENQSNKNKTPLPQNRLNARPSHRRCFCHPINVQRGNRCMSSRETIRQIMLDERNHVEEPLLEQLEGLGWEIIDLDDKQLPADSHRETFTEVVMLPVLGEQLKVINPWIEDDQIEEVTKQLIANFPGTGLIENNKHVLNLLLENTSVSENRQTGENSPTVRFIDFENRDKNRFTAVCQYKVRILGTEHHIFPDIVLFVNGLPVVLIECKSPRVKDAIPEAIDQILRYSEQRGAQGEGNAQLFHFNQFVVATCRQEAKFGTITTHIEKHFYRWADPYPRTLNDLEHGSGSPNDQQRLVAGMMDKDNLLNLIRTFTLFSTNDKGQTIKIVGRYQQFRAVKLAVKRLIEGTTPRERSGIIWHTQGSGKSLTMMFMVREMHRHPRNWQTGKWYSSLTGHNSKIS